MLGKKAFMFIIMMAGELFIDQDAVFKLLKPSNQQDPWKGMQRLYNNLYTKSYVTKQNI